MLPVISALAGMKGPLAEAISKYLKGFPSSDLGVVDIVSHTAPSRLEAVRGSGPAEATG